MNYSFFIGINDAHTRVHFNFSIIFFNQIAVLIIQKIKIIFIGINDAHTRVHFNFSIIFFNRIAVSIIQTQKLRKYNFCK